MKNIINRIIKLREDGRPVAEIASIVHMPELEVRTILGELTFRDKVILVTFGVYASVKANVVLVGTSVKESVTSLTSRLPKIGNYWKAGIAMVVAIAAKYSMLTVPVVHVASGATGVVVMNTIGNAALLGVVFVAFAAAVYYVLTA